MEIKKGAALRSMSVDELEVYRNQIARESDKLKTAFRAAGAVKSEKVASTPRAIGQAKIAEGRAIIALAAAEEAENG